MTQINVPIAELPEPYAAWLDPELPLPDDVTLLIKRPLRPGVVRALLAASPLLVVGGAILLILLLGAGLRDMLSALCGLPLALGLAALGVFTYWAGRREQRHDADRAVGRLRDGLFLGPEALLLRLDSARCHLAPRAQIAAVHHAVVQNPNWPGAQRQVAIIVRRTSEKGVRLRFWAQDVAAPPLQPEEIAPRIAAWAGIAVEEGLGTGE